VRERENGDYESRPKFVNSSRMCVYACAYRVHCRCSLPPYLNITGALCVLLLFAPPSRTVFSSPPILYAAPHAFLHPSLSTALEIHLVVHLASSHLASLLFLFLTPCHNLSSPRRSHSRCNERCTLLSSCSRRCFYSAAQSVSAQLPARFTRRFVSAGYACLIRNEPNSHGKKLKNVD